MQHQAEQEKGTIMAETPEFNVTYGPQMRAVVRSALTHVLNKLIRASNIEDESQTAALQIVTEEYGNWPFSDDIEDTLPQWLFHRFATRAPRSEDGNFDWDAISDEDKAYWGHEAAAVRRAVGRGGFKPSYEDTVPMGRNFHAPSVNNPRRNDDGSFTIYDSRNEISDRFDPR